MTVNIFSQALLKTLDTNVDTIDTNVDSINSVSPKLVTRATALLPQSTAGALFTVSGRCMICDIIGEVTVEIHALLNNTKLTSNPTVGADVDLCAVLDINADVVGTMYHITGTLADAMIATTSGAFESQALPIAIAAGTIDLYCSASEGGQIKWSLFYIPIDAGATIVAV